MSDVDETTSPLVTLNRRRTITVRDCIEALILSYMEGQFLPTSAVELHVMAAPKWPAWAVESVARRMVIDGTLAIDHEPWTVTRYVLVPRETTCDACNGWGVLDFGDGNEDCGCMTQETR